MISVSIVHSTLIVKRALVMHFSSIFECWYQLFPNNPLAWLKFYINLIRLQPVFMIYFIYLNINIINMLVLHHQLVMSGSVHFSQPAQSSDDTAAKVLATCTQGINREQMVRAYSEWASTYEQVRKDFLDTSKLARVTIFTQSSTAWSEAKNIEECPQIPNTENKINIIEFCLMFLVRLIRDIGCIANLMLLRNIIIIKLPKVEKDRHSTISYKSDLWSQHVDRRMQIGCSGRGYSRVCTAQQTNVVQEMFTSSINYQKWQNKKITNAQAIQNSAWMHCKVSIRVRRIEKVSPSCDFYFKGSLVLPSVRLSHIDATDFNILHFITYVFCRQGHGSNGVWGTKTGSGGPDRPPKGQQRCQDTGLCLWNWCCGSRGKLVISCISRVVQKLRW